MNVTCSCLARQARCTKDLIQTRVPMDEQGLIQVLPVSDFTNILQRLSQNFYKHLQMFIPLTLKKMSVHICIFKENI